VWPPDGGADNADGVDGVVFATWFAFIAIDWSFDVIPAADARDLARLDTAHVWHPYAPMPASPPPHLVSDAEGVRIRLSDGRQLIDGMSSWWAAIHGYRHPRLDQAARDQLTQMSHVMFGGLTHEPAIRLAEQLVSISPQGLERVFFSDSGSVAVEVAIKMAAQYWQARDQPQKTRLITVRGGYHGDTLGAMSVCDPVDGMHHLFAGLLAKQEFAPRPPGGVAAGVDPGWRAAAESIVADHAAESAAFIVEPVVQGAGGMRFYDPGYVVVFRELCDQYDLLLILDEIATGFGRTGVMFAAELAGVSPDVMCVGKALTGGYLSMAATLCTSDVASTISGGAGGAFMHGPTFMANPLAAAIALANVDLLLSRDWAADVRRVEAGLREGLASAVGSAGVVDVRVLGAIGVIELDHQVDVAAATRRAISLGVWLRPFRNLVYAMPPYICSADEIATIGRAVVEAAAG
jgi:adenosylmethionine---8-amino-7-oxononanoate aminotransferase